MIEFITCVDECWDSILRIGSLLLNYHLFDVLENMYFEK